VAAAVRDGQCASGYSHFTQSGFKEGRRWFRRSIANANDGVSTSPSPSVALPSEGRGKRKSSAPLPSDTAELNELRHKAAHAMEEGRYDDGSELFAQIFRLAPGDVNALVGRGRCSAKRGHHVLARLLFEEALELDPANKYAAAALAALGDQASP